MYINRLQFWIFHQSQNPKPFALVFFSFIFAFSSSFVQLAIRDNYYKKDIFRKNTYINNSPLCTRTYMQAVYLVHLGRNYLFYLVVH